MWKRLLILGDKLLASKSPNGLFLNPPNFGHQMRPVMCVKCKVQFHLVQPWFSPKWLGQFFLPTFCKTSLRSVWDWQIPTGNDLDNIQFTWQCWGYICCANVLLLAPLFLLVKSLSWHELFSFAGLLKIFVLPKRSLYAAGDRINIMGTFSTEEAGSVEWPDRWYSISFGIVLRWFRQPHAS